ncbi:alpha/beta fold hydrolase [Mucilaginibacter pedocola]|uniref:Hydrolase n=1 Tax=Mucilaginibacter pedocola TaxID=1792845 RepID=A0A1S9PKK0_9SPHI|nr:alpha/beta hydrolase [Mucilaginibacter pedocola]OOQ61493.1 hydrolase [Mucilaginibacter pedocola]
MKTNQVKFKSISANGINLFYREAGPANAPVILLLHGYPTSSFMYRNLIPILSEKYHVLAPDLPGFGFSDMPAKDQFEYTFDNFTKTIQAFIDQLGVKRFAVYIFDYGAPTGLRLAMANPEKITGIISQNGNAYEEGLSYGWNPIKKYWENPSKENREALHESFTMKITRWQYEEGVADKTAIAPETYTLDQHFLDRPGAADIQLDILRDYRTNVALYPAFHAYFRSHQPKLLAVWGNKDPYFLPAGAEAYKKDLPNAKVVLYNTGHFALETHVEEIGAEIMKFMETLPK